MKQENKLPEDSVEVRETLSDLYESKPEDSISNKQRRVKSKIRENRF